MSQVSSGGQPKKSANDLSLLIFEISTNQSTFWPNFDTNGSDTLKQIHPPQKKYTVGNWDTHLNKLLQFTRNALASR